MTARDERAVWVPQSRPSWTERIVRRAGGVLEKRVSRRSFIARTTMVGSAVAFSGTKVITRPVSAYAAILACPPGSLCLDGYTEFCCVINGGKNTCPPGSIPSGWWRADFSYFCGGAARYFIDCNRFSPPPGCGCAKGNCNHRKTYCNHFRYGQCHQEIGGTGVIACRMVLCTPPYTKPELGCSPSGAVDNSTAHHITGCLIPSAASPPPPPAPPAAVLAVSACVVAPAENLLSAFVRGSDGGVWYRDFSGATWSPWRSLGARTSSTIVAAVLKGHTYVFARQAGSLKLIYRHRLPNGTWSAWQSLGGALTADPSVVVHSNTLWLFERANDHKLYYRVLLGKKWAGWFGLGGNLRSNPVAVSHPAGLHLFQRTTDGSLWFRRWKSGWTPWRSLRGALTSEPAAVLHGNTLFLFQRANDRALWYRVSNGSAWGPWKSLGGYLTSDPVAVSHDGALWVFRRGADSRTLYYRRYTNGSWSPWVSMQGWLTADPAAISTSHGLYVFQRANDAGLWYKRWDGSLWSEWQPLGGVLAPVRAWD